ncbi:MAG: L-serine ammonia-lyase, iron-sulfur-dependent, subunit alpha [Clostridiales bacterium]|nr:L-serine ammonia-lyase, iron-sulfur-dependent, subunit alpha [Clostridiales bacterium]
MYRNGLELLKLTEELNCTIAEILYKKEDEYCDKPQKMVHNNTKEILKVMRNSSQAAIDHPEEYMGHIIGGDAKKMNDYSKTKTYSGSFITKAMARAFSSSEVNASMGKICAAPTAGSCGILPAALFTAEEQLGLDEESLINGLLTSAVIGEIITMNATVSGAEGGCQAECGSAAAMAAGMLVILKDGTPEQALNASAIALKNIMGLVCDPIAGLVEAPCAKRNASGVVNAMISADMSLAGVKSIIPFDEVVDAMFKVGKALPITLKETALGGIAKSKTAQVIQNEIYKRD